MIDDCQSGSSVGARSSLWAAWDDKGGEIVPPQKRCRSRSRSRSLRETIGNCSQLSSRKPLRSPSAPVPDCWVVHARQSSVRDVCAPLRRSPRWRRSSSPDAEPGPGPPHSRLPHADSAQKRLSMTRRGQTRPTDPRSLQARRAIDASHCGSPEPPRVHRPPGAAASP
jgi:hypothetical protein